jgi:hypothetical protein
LWNIYRKKVRPNQITSIIRMLKSQIANMNCLLPYWCRVVECIYLHTIPVVVHQFLECCSL